MNFCLFESLFLSEFMLKLLLSRLFGYFRLLLPTEFSNVTIPLIENTRLDGVHAPVKTV